MTNKESLKLVEERIELLQRKKEILEKLVEKENESKKPEKKESIESIFKKMVKQNYIYNDVFKQKYLLIYTGAYDDTKWKIVYNDQYTLRDVLHQLQEIIIDEEVLCVYIINLKTKEFVILNYDDSNFDDVVKKLLEGW
jgi:hypothetical protein